MKELLNTCSNIIDNYYGISKPDISPFRDKYIVSVKDKKYVFKKMNLNHMRIQFIHEFKEHLINKGFVNIDRYLLTKNSEPFIIIDDSTYTLSEYPEGTEINFDSNHETFLSSKTLALLHSCSTGFKYSEKCIPRNILGELPEQLKKRIEELKKLRKFAKNNKKKRFDIDFLEWFDYFYKLAEEALNELSQSNYNKVIEKEKQNPRVCHLDFSHQNIIVNNNIISIINFEHCGFELPIYDLANLIRRKMRKSDWDLSYAKQIIQNYSSIQPLTSDEMEILRIILKFPQKFWRIANNYYNKKRSLTDNLLYSKLKETINEASSHQNFIQNF